MNEGVSMCVKMKMFRGQNQHTARVRSASFTLSPLLNRVFTRHCEENKENKGENASIISTRSDLVLYSITLKETELPISRH
jgi:hypothetical protein